MILELSHLRDLRNERRIGVNITEKGTMPVICFKRKEGWRRADSQKDETRKVRHAGVRAKEIAGQVESVGETFVSKLKQESQLMRAFRLQTGILLE